MTATLSPQEFEQLRAFIEKTCGILVGKEKAYLIESRLSSMLPETGCETYGELYNKLKNGADPNLLDKIVDRMTTNETLWFRDNHPFRIFEEVLLPQYAQEAAAGKRFRIRLWSSASSTGQEPYSLAMVFLEAQAKNPALKKIKLEIIASDISTTALRIAMMGRYDSISINRGLPVNYRNKYFKAEGRVHVLSDEVKKMVTLKKMNLQKDFSSLGKFDIIFCRNVAIYFSDEFKKDLFARFKRSLNPSGYFFLGASESLSAYSQEYEMLEHMRGIYYRLK
ncbi:MAG: CheR family methyltransferase [Candidatus Sumerlaeia bacterium]